MTRASSYTLPPRWWAIVSPPARADENMALDEALVPRARDESVGILRIYSWSRPAISFGRNETLAGRFDRERLAASEFDLVRRPTGGRALLHVHEVTYAIALPLAPDVGWRKVYDRINELLLQALRPHVDARIVVDAETTPIRPVDALCFSAPAVGEIVVDNAKLVASAVWRDRDGFLQQGSILTHGDQEPLRLLATHNGATAPVATLGKLKAPTDFATIASSLTAALAKDHHVIDMQADDRLQRDAELRVNHFRDPLWLWRR